MNEQQFLNNALATGIFLYAIRQYKENGNSIRYQTASVRTNKHKIVTGITLNDQDVLIEIYPNTEMICEIDLESLHDIMREYPETHRINITKTLNKDFLKELLEQT